MNWNRVFGIVSLIAVTACGSKRINERYDGYKKANDQRYEEAIKKLEDFVARQPNEIKGYVILEPDLQDKVITCAERSHWKPFFHLDCYKAIEEIFEARLKIKYEPEIATPTILFYHAHPEKMADQDMIHKISAESVQKVYNDLGPKRFNVNAKFILIEEEIKGVFNKTLALVEAQERKKFANYHDAQDDIIERNRSVDLRINDIQNQQRWQSLTNFANSLPGTRRQGN